MATGAWKGLSWVKGPDLFSCDPLVDYCGANISLFSFSGGYLAFYNSEPGDTEEAGPSGPVPMVSKDGLTWRTGKVMDMGGLEAGVVQVSEGPKGLMAVIRSGAMGLCGSYPIWIEGLWTSADGLTWKQLNMATAFGGAAVYDISAGPGGYIADGVATDGITTTVWTSADGRIWKPVTLPGQVLGAATADNVTSFAGGYALEAEDFKGCGTFTLLTNSIWWSQDGGDWTQSDFQGASSSRVMSTTIYRTAPGRLLAIVDSSTNGGKTITTSYLTSTDGKAWTAVTGPVLKGDSRGVFSYGDRALIASWTSGYNDPAYDPENPPPPPVIVAVDSGGKLATLKQTGTAPEILPDYGGGYGYFPAPNAALGPSGLLVTDGQAVWFGVPTS